MPDNSLNKPLVESDQMLALNGRCVEQARLTDLVGRDVDQELRRLKRGTARHARDQREDHVVQSPVIRIVLYD
jgi:hypothetical protein